MNWSLHYWDQVLILGKRVWNSNDLEGAKVFIIFCNVSTLLEYKNEWAWQSVKFIIFR